MFVNRFCMGCDFDSPVRKRLRSELAASSRDSLTCTVGRTSRANVTALEPDRRAGERHRERTRQKKGSDTRAVRSPSCALRLVRALLETQQGGASLQVCAFGEPNRVAQAFRLAFQSRKNL